MTNKFKQKFRKLGFTLMEVNLAIFIMATGVLAMASLYPLGYRENQQSRDDVWAAAEADRIFNQLHAVLGDRTIKWNKWKNAVKNLDGSVGNWKLYCDENKGWVPQKKGTIKSLASKALTTLKDIPDSSPTKEFNLDLNGDRVYAIVVQPGRIAYPGEEPIIDYSRIVVSMRISRNAGTLFAQPVYFTEMHFQGDQGN